MITRRTIILLMPLLGFAFLVFFLWRGLSLDPHAIPSTMIGKKLPSFTLAELNHTQTQLTEQNFKGQVTLLNVFASWCVACEQEHPLLMDISLQYHLPIIGLNYKDQQVDAQHLLEKTGNPYRLIGFDQNGLVAINLGVYGTPETFIIDKNGIIRYKQIGPITEADWKNTLQPLVSKLQGETS